MSWASAVVLIVMISAIAGVLRSRNHHAAPHRDQAASAGREKQLEHEVTELRERIKVLERIATDANSVEARRTRTIADEIENLRDR